MLHRSAFSQLILCPLRLSLEGRRGHWLHTLPTMVVGVDQRTSKDLEPFLGSPTKFSVRGQHLSMFVSNEDSSVTLLGGSNAKKGYPGGYTQDLEFQETFWVQIPPLTTKTFVTLGPRPKGAGLRVFPTITRHDPRNLGFVGLSSS